MAWALAAGVGFQLTPSMTLDIGYRYLNSGTVNTLLNPQTGATIQQTKRRTKSASAFATTLQ